MSDGPELVEEVEQYLSLTPEVRAFVDALHRLPEGRQERLLDTFGAMYGRQGVRMPVDAMRLFTAMMRDEAEGTRCHLRAAMRATKQGGA